MKVSIQGYKGSFHYVIASRLLPGEEVVERDTFDQVFEDVVSANSKVGIIAIENSIAGAILENYDRLRDYQVSVIGEYYLRIAHSLLALPGQEISDIKEVHSHPMAIKQCLKYLRKYPKIKPVESADTALSVKEIMEQKLEGVAGIASKEAGELYGAEAIAEGIETDKHNYTRFVLFVKNGSKIDFDYPTTDSRKMSMYIETAHRPGGLLQALQVLNEFDLNMTMLVSRPVVGSPWEYGFYIDFLYHKSLAGKMYSIMDQVRDHTSKLLILGDYEDFDNISEERVV